MRPTYLINLFKLSNINPLDLSEPITISAFISTSSSHSLVTL